MGLYLSHPQHLVESLFLPHIEVRSGGSICQLYSRSGRTSLLDLPGHRGLDGQVRVDTVDSVETVQVLVTGDLEDRS